MPFSGKEYNAHLVSDGMDAHVECGQVVYWWSVNLRQNEKLVKWPIKEKELQLRTLITKWGHKTLRRTPRIQNAVLAGTINDKQFLGILSMVRGDKQQWRLWRNPNKYFDTFWNGNNFICRSWAWGISNGPLLFAWIQDCLVKCLDQGRRATPTQIGRYIPISFCFFVIDWILHFSYKNLCVFVYVFFFLGGWKLAFQSKQNNILYKDHRVYTGAPVLQDYHIFSSTDIFLVLRM